MSWYSEVLKRYSKKTIVTVSIFLAIQIMFAVLNFANGGTFVWHSITPIDQPSIFERVIYSALTFVTLGAGLYYLRFYQFLSLLFGNDRQSYRQVKSLIWLGLMWLMYAVLVPASVNVLNAIISFLYNSILFIIYVSPDLLVLSVILITFMMKRQKILSKKEAQV